MTCPCENNAETTNLVGKKPEAARELHQRLSAFRGAL